LIGLYHFLLDTAIFVPARLIDVLRTQSLAPKSSGRQKGPVFGSFALFHSWVLMFSSILPISTIVVACLDCLLYIVDQETFSKILVSHSDVSNDLNGLIPSYACCTILTTFALAVVETVSAAGVLAFICLRSLEMRLWAANAITLIFDVLRRLFGVHFYQKYRKIDSERLQYRQSSRLCGRRPPIERASSASTPLRTAS